ncbi:MAG: hypothetical protein IPF75_19080 [Bacteroidetes bacterium]|nr:hypothetical protein [Bacteroidota bacterium]
MKKLIVIAGAIGIVIFQSCGSDKKTESETVATEQPTVQSEVATTDSTQMQTPGQPLEINSTQPAISSAPVTTPTTAAPAATATAAGMNPAHGQPGHRCDIAVGAPLSSPPNKQTTATPSITPTSPTINSTTPTITPSSSSPQIQTTPVVSPAAAGPTPAGMNPPHGQPGHDCAVAVGAPLKK